MITKSRPRFHAFTRPFQTAFDFDGKILTINLISAPIIL